MKRILKSDFEKMQGTRAFLCELVNNNLFYRAWIEPGKSYNVAFADCPAYVRMDDVHTAEDLRPSTICSVHQYYNVKSPEASISSLSKGVPILVVNTSELVDVCKVLADGQYIIVIDDSDKSEDDLRKEEQENPYDGIFERLDKLGFYVDMLDTLTVIGLLNTLPKYKKTYPEEEYKAVTIQLKALFEEMTSTSPLNVKCIVRKNPPSCPYFEPAGCKAYSLKKAIEELLNEYQ